MSTRPVLGKRSRSLLSRSPSLLSLKSVSSSSSFDPSPKRSKTVHVVDDDSNKENIPPPPITAVPPPLTPREVRAKERERRSQVTAPRPDIKTPRKRSSSTNLELEKALSELSTTPQHSNKKPAPRHEDVEKTLPTPPTTPPVAKARSLYAKARTLIRGGANAVIGREDERKKILHFLTSFNDDSSTDDDSPALYISGSPGTGKTALINEVLAAAACPELKQIYINCTGLDASAIWTRAWEQIHDDASKTRKGKGKDSKASFEQALAKGIKCVIIFDELDHLAGKTNGIASIADVFALPFSHRSSLRVIGISNNHTLTSSNIADSIPESVATLHFAPYTSPQMVAILKARLSSVSSFISPATLSLASAKTAALTGDLRALFSVFVRAVDEAEAADAETVSPAHVLAAIRAEIVVVGNTTKAGKGSDAEKKTRALGLQAKLALCALVLSLRRSSARLSLTTSGNATKAKPGKETATAVRKATRLNSMAVHSFYSTILKRTDASLAFEPVSRTEFTDLLGLLETSGLVDISSTEPATPKKSGLKGKEVGVSRVGLAEGVREEEVVKGLGLAPGSEGEGSVVDAELKMLWKRETARIAREAKAATDLRPELIAVPLEDATED